MIKNLKTKEEIKHIKDKLFDGIRNKIFSFGKQKHRLDMKKYGFIFPEHITTLDFKLSMAKSKDEEDELKKEEEHDDCDLFESDY